jgi:hypothetical protein
MLSSKLWTDDQSITRQMTAECARSETTRNPRGVINGIGCYVLTNQSEQSTLSEHVPQVPLPYSQDHTTGPYTEPQNRVQILTLPYALQCSSSYCVSVVLSTFNFIKGYEALPCNESSG